MNSSFTDRDLDYQTVFRPFLFQTPSYLEGCSGTSAQSKAMWEKGVYTSIGLVSMVSSLFVALTIFYNPKLRIHPSKLIGFMCICEGISCFNALIWVIGPIDISCYFGFHYLYSWTFFKK